MTGPATAPMISLEGCLSSVAAAYGGFLKIRSDLYGRRWLTSHRIPCRVISVGNIVLGGTGKTPMTIYLAQQLQDMGIRTAILSRGYGGRAERGGGIVSNGDKLLMGSEDAGDEPYMMARILNGVPILVGQDRYRSGMVALEAFSPEVIVLDDAFQHLRLERDINLVLLDARAPFGNGHLFPRGTLREPLSALSRADAIIMTRHPGNMPPAPSILVRAGNESPRKLPVFHTVHTPYVNIVGPTGATQGTRTQADTAAEILRNPVFAFSAIARNSEFVTSLKEAGYTVTGTRFFPDHYRYSKAEIHGIFEAAHRANVGILATTEKDYARIGEGIQWPMPVLVAGVKISFGYQAEAFHLFILEKLGFYPPGEAR